MMVPSKETIYFVLFVANGFTADIDELHTLSFFFRRIHRCRYDSGVGGPLDSALRLLA